MTDAAAVLPEPEPIDSDDVAEHVEVIEHERVEHEQPMSAAVVPYERPTPLVPGHDIPIIPAAGELRDLAAMAVTLAGALAVPKPLQGRPNDVFQVLLSARDLGVAVTTAMREFHVIDGRVTLSPKVKLAMVNERGGREGWAVWPDPSNDAERATWYATRRDRPGIEFRSGFSWEMAKGAGMVSGPCFPRDHAAGQTCKCKANWKMYPERMVSWRALGYLLDDVFPEVATGIYSPDELGGMTDEQGNFIDVASTEPLPGTSAPRGHNQPPPPLLIDSDADAHAELVRRLDAIKAAGDEPRDALKLLWQERDDNDVPRLPPIAQLPARQHSRAKALVASIEQRISKGEWGDDVKAAHEKALSDAVSAAETPEGDDSAETADEPADAAASSTDALAGAEQYEHEVAESADARRARAAQVARDAGLTPPASWSSDTELAQLVATEVKAMELSDVLTQLAERQIEPKGNPQHQRKQLAELLYAERGGKPKQQPTVPPAAHESVEHPTLDDA